MEVELCVCDLLELDYTKLHVTQLNVSLPNRKVRTRKSSHEWLIFCFFLLQVIVGLPDMQEEAGTAAENWRMV